MSTGNLNTMSIEEILEKQYDVLGHYLVDGLTEIRIIRTGQSYFCGSKEEFIKTAKEFVGSDAYVGINPRKEASGKASAVSHVTAVVIDIDPVRGKGEPSTEEQHKASIELGTRLAERLKGGLVCSSGSGCHVYFPIQPVQILEREELSDSVRRFGKAIKQQYETDTLKIDSIFDFPRVIRLWGSHNTRSNRQCVPLGQIERFERIALDLSQTKREEVKAQTPKTDCEQRFQRLTSSNKRLKEIVDGNIKYESPSEADFEFVCILGKAHFSCEDIKSLWSYNTNGNNEPKKGDVERILSKLKVDAQSQSGESYSLIHHSDRYYSSLRSRSMGIRTGLKSLDEMISGLKQQKLYILPAARPNVGKTSLLTQILTNVAEQGHVCLFYPTEVGPEPIFDKIVSRKTGLSLKKFQNGSFNEDDYKKIDSIKSSIQGLPLVVVEDFAVTTSTVEQGIKKFAPSVVAVDFFQAMKWNDPDSVGEKSDAVRKFKEMAGDYKIPIIITSQLNRSDGKADLKQLKSTGTLEELGDVIAYLYCDNPLYGECDLLVMKSKYSATGVIKMHFNRSICEFKEEANDSIIP